MYVQNDTLLLAISFRNKCIEICDLDLSHFLSAPGLAWQACLKKSEVELELLTNIDLLLMAGNGIRDEIRQVIHRYAKADNKYMKNYNEDMESSYLEYLDANNLHGWAMSQQFLVNGFDRIEELSKFDERFIQNHDEDSNKEYFLEVDVEYLKNLFNLHSDLPFLPERKKIKKCNKLVCDFYDKNVFHIKALQQALNHGLILKKSAQGNSI